MVQSTSSTKSYSAWRSGHSVLHFACASFLITNMACDTLPHPGVIHGLTWPCYSLSQASVRALEEQAAELQQYILKEHAAVPKVSQGACCSCNTSALDGTLSTSSTHACAWTVAEATFDTFSTGANSLPSSTGAARNVCTAVTSLSHFLFVHRQSGRLPVSPFLPSACRECNRLHHFTHAPTHQPTHSTAALCSN